MRGTWGWAVLLLSAAAQAQELREIRIWEGPEGTRVVLDLDAASTFQLQTLADPQRVVIDLAGVKRAAEIGSAQDGRGLVKRVRTAEHDNDLRVVLDVDGPITARGFALDPNSEYRYRVVIDLAPPATAIDEAAPVTMVAADEHTPAPTQIATSEVVTTESAAAEVAPTQAAPTQTSAVPQPVADQVPVVTKDLPASADPIGELARQSIAKADAAAVDVAKKVDVAKAEPPKGAAAKINADATRARPTIIAIDAGHGGEDPGAKGKLGTQEKDIALSIARKLARMTDAQPGYKAVLIRDGDYFIPLRGRINKARAAQADLFVSIHCNASPNREAEGSAVYALSPRGATNEHARWLANKENASDLIGGIELQDKDDTLAAVLFDISQTSAMEASIDVGGRVLGALAEVNNLLKTDVQQAGFVVLKSPDIPSILVETAFISNPREERQLANPQYQAQMAQQILSGIKGYFETYRPQPAAPTQVTADAGDEPKAQLVDVGYRKPSGKGKRKN